MLIKQDQIQEGLERGHLAIIIPKDKYWLDVEDDTYVYQEPTDPGAYYNNITMDEEEHMLKWMEEHTETISNISRSHWTPSQGIPSKHGPNVASHWAVYNIGAEMLTTFEIFSHIPFISMLTGYLTANPLARHNTQHRVQRHPLDPLLRSNFSAVLWTYYSVQR